MSKELIRLQDLVMEFDGERILDGINLYITFRISGYGLALT